MLIDGHGASWGGLAATGTVRVASETAPQRTRFQGNGRFGCFKIPKFSAARPTMVGAQRGLGSGLRPALFTKKHIPFLHLIGAGPDEGGDLGGRNSRSTVT